MRLYVAQRPGGGSIYISEYGDVRALQVYVSALLVYDMVCFSTSNYMKSHNNTYRVCLYVKLHEKVWFLGLAFI